MYSWMNSTKGYPQCYPKTNEYKEQNFGYKINPDKTQEWYVGNRDCMEYNLDDDWCHNCNEESGKPFIKLNSTLQRSVNLLNVISIQHQHSIPINV